MHYEVIIDGCSYGEIHKSNLRIQTVIPKISYETFGKSIYLPGRQDTTLEFNIPRTHNLSLLFQEKQIEYIYYNNNNYKFDVSLAKYLLFDDMYTFDYGNIILEETTIKNCFLSDYHFDENYSNATLCFDYINTTTYFEEIKNDRFK